VSKHIYILDTCVLLHDPTAIFKFKEHDIYIPLAVIDDLDSDKTAKGSMGWSAREVFRQIDKFNLLDLTTKGVTINEEKGKLFIFNTEAPVKNGESPSIVKLNSDNALIECAILLKSKFPKRKVAIVTKDVGLRVRAISWGCLAENFKSDLIQDVFYTGFRTVEIDNMIDWEMLWKVPEHFIDNFSEIIQAQLADMSPNEFVVFKWGESKCFARFKKNKLWIMKDDKNGHTNGNGNGNNVKKFSGIVAKNIEQKCAMELLADDEVSLVSLSGAAGTGKTILTLAVALQKIDEGTYDKLIIIKPIVPVSGRDLGYLPGDKFEKMSHWLGPVKDNIAQLSDGKNGTRTLEDMVENNIIEVEAMTYIQGRSIPRAFIVVDECQNLTSRECRMVVERCAKGSKVILLGDVSQVENPYLDSKSCGLAHAMNGGRGKENCGSITLTNVVRSVLASLASEIFKKSGVME
jgi:PhoH-like ATPase